jgi:hypothetical protein
VRALRIDLLNSFAASCARGFALACVRRALERRTHDVNRIVWS